MQSLDIFSVHRIPLMILTVHIPSLCSWFPRVSPQLRLVLWTPYFSTASASWISHHVQNVTPDLTHSCPHLLYPQSPHRNCWQLYLPNNSGPKSWRPYFFVLRLPVSTSRSPVAFWFLLFCVYPVFCFGGAVWCLVSVPSIMKFHNSVAVESLHILC